jgi:hypothetical protein
MVVGVDVRTRQGMVIEFLAGESPSLIEIRRRLRSDRCWVRRRVRRFKGGEKDVGDRPCSGRPATVATAEAKDKINPWTVRRNRGQKGGGYGRRQSTCLQVYLPNTGVGNAHHRTQKSPKNICAELVQRSEKEECFSVKDDYWWWHVSSSLRRTDENTISGLTSSVSTQETIQGADLRWWSHGERLVGQQKNCVSGVEERWGGTLTSD